MEIWNKADMEHFRDKVNSGRTFAGKTVKIMADIDLEGSTTKQWIPIGNYATNTALRFEGILEGNGHKIDNLYINNKLGYQGLFGLLNGKVENITINSGSITSGYYVGSIAGNISTKGQIINCQNIVSVTSTSYLYISSRNYSYTGGIAGGNEGVITGTTNQGIVNSVGICTGGIIGQNLGTIQNTKNIATTVKVTASSNIEKRAHAGGIAGENRGGSIFQCYNIATVDSNGYYLGGIVGINQGNIQETYNKGSVSAIAAVGGITGESGVRGKILDCYNFGSVTSSSASGGGAGGISGNILAGAILQNCYNIGEISIPHDDYKGGICGYIISTSTVSNCYWLTGKASYGIGNTKSNSGAVSKTSAQLMQIATSLSNKFEQDTSNINNGYPILLWQKDWLL